MPNQYRTVICRDGWCYLLLVATVFTWAILREANLLLIVGGMLSGPVFLSWRLAAVTLRRLEVRRRMPRAVYAGDPLSVDIELLNARKRLGSWALVVEDHLCRQSDPHRDGSVRPTMLFSYLPAGASERQAYGSRLPERGRYRLGPLSVSTRFPFGLFRRTITFELSDTLTVLPRLGRLTPAWSLRHSEGFRGPHRGQQPVRAPGDFFGVREWQPGDSLRWVHWRSTARHGTLVTRQFERPGGRDVAVLVDLWQPSEPDEEDLENVELAVSFAATVVADLCRKGSLRLLMGVAGSEPACISGPASVPLMEEALENLAVAKASREDRLPALLETAGRQFRASTEVLLVSTRAHPLDETGHFTALRTDSLDRAFAPRIRVANTADPELAAYFQLE